jgi:hypothetical protein
VQLAWDFRHQWVIVGQVVHPKVAIGKAHIDSGNLSSTTRGVLKMNDRGREIRVGWSGVPVVVSLERPMSGRGKAGIVEVWHPIGGFGVFTLRVPPSRVRHGKLRKRVDTMKVQL